MTTSEVVMSAIILALGVLAIWLYRRGRRLRDETLVYAALAVWVIEVQARAALDQARARDT